MKSLGYRIIMWITNGDIHGIRHKCTNTPTHTRMMNFHHSPLISASKEVEYFPNWWRFAFVYTLRRCPWRIYAAAAAAEFDMAPVYFCKHFYIYMFCLWRRQQIRGCVPASEYYIDWWQRKILAEHAELRPRRCCAERRVHVLHANNLDDGRRNWFIYAQRARFARRRRWRRTWMMGASQCKKY